MIYCFNNIYEIIGKIILIVLISYIAYKREEDYKRWFFISLISPYIGAFSFIILYFLEEKEQIDKIKKENAVYYILKYELYIVFTSLIITGGLIGFEKYLK